MTLTKSRICSGVVPVFIAALKWKFIWPAVPVMPPKRADGRQFAALSVEVVANEDVAKEMFFEERVDSGSKELITGRRWNFGATAQLGAELTLTNREDGGLCAQVRFLSR